MRVNTAISLLIFGACTNATDPATEDRHHHHHPDAATGYSFPRTAWGDMLHDHLATPW
jgi:hypothetical protein